MTELEHHSNYLPWMNLCKKLGLELDKVEMEEVSKRWVADMGQGGTFLTKNVRPITLCFFSVAYVVGWYCDYNLDSIQGVLSLIVGAYFGSRGIEKVMGNNKHR